MEINTEVIAQDLCENYEVTVTQTSQKATLCSFRFCDAKAQREKVLYIMRAGDFAYFTDFSPKNAYLVIGLDGRNLPEVYCRGKQVPDIIFLHSDVDYTVLVNLLTDIFDRYQAWEEAMDACPSNPQGLQQLIDCSDALLHGDIILADYRFNYVAYSGSWANEIRLIRSMYHGQTPDYIVEELLTNPDYIRVQDSREIFEYPIHRHDSLVKAYCLNLFRPKESEYCCRILFVPKVYPASRADLFLLRIFAQKLNQIYHQLTDYSMSFISYHELRSAIRSGLNKEPVSRALLASALKFVDWNLEDNYQLMTFTPYFFENTKEINGVTQSQIELAIPHSCTVLHEDKIVAVINMTRRNQALNGKHPILDSSDIAQFIRDHLYKVGASAQFHDFSLLHQAYRESIVALHQGNMHDSTFWFYSFTSYSLPYMMELAQSEIHAKDLLHPGLRTLQEYDQAHGSEYVKTLRSFIENKYNATHTAEALYLHRTTLLKHLARIRELTHMDLDDWNTRLHLAISLHMMFH